MCLNRDRAGDVDENSAAETKVPAAGELMVRRLSPNVLTLDYCDLELGGETESDIYFYEAQLKIFRHHGLDRNPWMLLSLTSTLPVK